MYLLVISLIIFLLLILLLFFLYLLGCCNDTFNVVLFEFVKVLDCCKHTNILKDDDALDTIQCHFQYQRTWQISAMIVISGLSRSTRWPGPTTDASVWMTDMRSILSQFRTRAATANFGIDIHVSLQKDDHTMRGKKYLPLWSKVVHYHHCETWAPKWVYCVVRWHSSWHCKWSVLATSERHSVFSCVVFWPNRKEYDAQMVLAQ